MAYRKTLHGDSKWTWLVLSQPTVPVQSHTAPNPVRIEENEKKNTHKYTNIHAHGERANAKSNAATTAVRFPCRFVCIFNDICLYVSLTLWFYVVDLTKRWRMFQFILES